MPTTDQPIQQRAATGETACEAISLCVEYGHRRVLRDVSLCLRAGEVVQLRGANGSGKTTLLQCLATVTRPTSGQVLWFGRNALGNPAQRKWLGAVSHDSRLYPQLTLHENLLFVARLCGADRPADRVERMLTRIGLAAYSRFTPAQISRGMRQRVSIARAIIHDPAMVLLDEPFCGLDVAGRNWLFDWLAEARGRGQAICLSTHEAQGLERITDRALVLCDGRLSQVDGATEFGLDRQSTHRTAA